MSSLKDNLPINSSKEEISSQMKLYSIDDSWLHPDYITEHSFTSRFKTGGYYLYDVRGFIFNNRSIIDCLRRGERTDSEGHEYVAPEFFHLNNDEGSPLKSYPHMLTLRDSQGLTFEEYLRDINHAEGRLPLMDLGRAVDLMSSFLLIKNFIYKRRKDQLMDEIKIDFNYHTLLFTAFSQMSEENSSRVMTMYTELEDLESPDIFSGFPLHTLEDGICDKFVISPGFYTPIMMRTQEEHVLFRPTVNYVKGPDNKRHDYDIYLEDDEVAFEVLINRDAFERGNVNMVLKLVLEKCKYISTKMGFKNIDYAYTFDNDDLRYHKIICIPDRLYKMKKKNISAYVALELNKSMYYLHKLVRTFTTYDKGIKAGKFKEKCIPMLEYSHLPLFPIAVRTMNELSKDFLYDELQVLLLSWFIQVNGYPSGLKQLLQSCDGYYDVVDRFRSHDMINKTKGPRVRYIKQDMKMSARSDSKFEVMRWYLFKILTDKPLVVFYNAIMDETCYWSCGPVRSEVGTSKNVSKVYDSKKMFSKLPIPSVMFPFRYLIDLRGMKDFLFDKGYLDDEAMSYLCSSIFGRPRFSMSWETINSVFDQPLNIEWYDKMKDHFHKKKKTMVRVVKKKKKKKKKVYTISDHMEKLDDDKRKSKEQRRQLSLKKGREWKQKKKDDKRYRKLKIKIPTRSKPRAVRTVPYNNVPVRSQNNDKRKTYPKYVPEEVNDVTIEVDDILNTFWD